MHIYRGDTFQLVSQTKSQVRSDTVVGSPVQVKVRSSDWFFLPCLPSDFR